MEFVDIPFPERIAMQAQSDPMWSTTIGQVISGHEVANQNWEDAKHVFDVGFAVRTATNYRLVRVHFHTVRGRAKSFPIKDFLDFEVAASEGKLLDADGVAPSANGTFNLHKRYGSGSDAYDRRITRPDNPIQVFRTRSAVTSDITGATTISYTAGTASITGHLSGDTYSWSGTFKVPSRYDSDRLPAAVVSKQPSDEGELLVDCGSITITEVRE